MANPEERHPIASKIVAIYDLGNCPRLFVDAEAEHVEVPDFVRERWKHQLVLDLDPKFPLDLDLGTDTLRADLSFQGVLMRCSIPYDAIWGLANRETAEVVALKPPPKDLKPPATAVEVTPPSASAREVGPKRRATPVSERAPGEDGARDPGRSRGRESAPRRTAGRGGDGKPRLRVIQGGKKG